MTRFALAALLAATVASTPALAQDYGRPDRPGYGYTDPRADNRGYDNRGYDGRDDARYRDGRDFGDRGYGDRAYGNANRARYFQLRGEGWSILRAAVGPDRTRDQRFVRATLQSFDRNRDGILTRHEGWQARRALTQRSGYGQRW